MNDQEDQSDVNRRAFLKKTSAAAFLAMVGGVELKADSASPAEGGGGAGPEKTKEPPIGVVKFGVIGAGEWGRKIIDTLAVKFKNMKDTDAYKHASVTGICDHFPSALSKAAKVAPEAKPYADYKDMLANPEVQAVIVATPTHTHRQIVEDALKAGKHVYCEMPLAHTIDDAKAIARAAKPAWKQFFQAGLVERSHPQRMFLHPFVRSGAMGRNVMVRAQWHKKDSWRRPAANAERAAALNWRLDAALSTGLMGEACINLLDAVPWFLGGAKGGGRPSHVTGWSSIALWDDGRTVADTAQCVFEFPPGANGAVRFFCDATLCNSFDSECELYYGSNATILMQPGNERRESKAWMFKEVDADYLGWQGYARTETFGSQLGISLAANASKQATLSNKTTGDTPPEIEPLQYALQCFMGNVVELTKTVKNYEEDVGPEDTAGFRQAVADTRKRNARADVYPAAEWADGLEATVLAIKANEAAVKGQKIEIKKEFFEI